MLIFSLKVKFKICCSHPKTGGRKENRTLTVFTVDQFSKPIRAQRTIFHKLVCVAGFEPAISHFQGE
jgi:hypothetical protein